jgi:predicted O-methyltransferase YrrM
MFMLKRIYKFWTKSIQTQNYPHLQAATIELNQIDELKKIYRWHKPAILNRPDIDEFDYIEDVNQRRLRDAEVLGTVMRNVAPQIALEIGTAEGKGTLLMATNSPNAQIFTVNIPPEDIKRGEGGRLTTIALEREKIGQAFRTLGIQSITQIYANTSVWEPDIGPIDVAFIDGCHDSDYVFNDTRKILRKMRPGGFILWHDFNLELAAKYHWINSVCQGIERLFARKLLVGRIMHVRDSWIAVYRVPIS